MTHHTLAHLSLDSLDSSNSKGLVVEVVVVADRRDPRDNLVVFLASIFRLKGQWDGIVHGPLIVKTSVVVRFRIRIRGSVPLTTNPDSDPASDPAFFISGRQDANKN